MTTVSEKTESPHTLVKNKKLKFRVGDKVRYRGIDTEVRVCFPNSQSGRDYFLESLAYAHESALVPIKKGVCKNHGD